MITLLDSTPQSFMTTNLSGRTSRGVVIIVLRTDTGIGTTRTDGTGRSGFEVIRSGRVGTVLSCGVLLLLLLLMMVVMGVSVIVMVSMIIPTSDTSSRGRVLKFPRRSMSIIITLHSLGPDVRSTTDSIWSSDRVGEMRFAGDTIDDGGRTGVGKDLSSGGFRGLGCGRDDYEKRCISVWCQGMI